MAPFISSPKRNYIFGGICSVAANASIRVCTLHTDFFVGSFMKLSKLVSGVYVPVFCVLYIVAFNSFLLFTYDICNLNRRWLI